MSVAVIVRFYPIEATVLHYYAQLHDTDPRKVARGMIKRCVASDRAIDLKALTVLLGEIPEFEAQPGVATDAAADLEAFIAIRKGRGSSHVMSTISTRQTIQEPLSGGDCAFTVTGLEFLLLTYYARCENCTREQVLRRFVRKYVLEDTNFDFVRFRRFVRDIIVPQLNSQRLQRLKDEMKPFFLPRTSQAAPAVDDR
jgi:hypothetical protein